MGAIVLPSQPDRGHPLINQPGILPRADVAGVIDAAWKHKIIQRAFTTFEPCQEARARALKELELNGPAGFLLDDDSARTNPTAELVPENRAGL